LTRRDVLRDGAVGALGLLTFTVAGAEQRLTPAAAREAGAEFKTLTSAEVRTLEAVGEVLLPGSAAKGLAHYIDWHLSVSPDQSMLIIRYLSVNPPFLPFYRQALRAIDAAAKAVYRKVFADLDPSQGHDFVARLAVGKLPSWAGPPAGLTYFVLRADAVDVVFGTAEGFAELGLPYAAHIAPPSPWGQK
jgi:hypothetical protein